MLPASEYVPDIFYSLERIILKCTQKSPSRRYDSMKALIADLKKALTDPDGDFVDIGPAMYNIEANEFNQERFGDTSSINTPSFEDEYEEFEEEEEYDDSEDRVKKITKILTIVVAVIVAFTVLFIAGRTIGFFRFGSGTVESESGLVVVPNLEGMTEDEAKEALEELGLGYNVRVYEESATFEEGYIIAQSQEAGSEVEENTTIRVTISSGLADVIIKAPDVVGESESTAQRLLNAVELKMETETAYSDSVDQGKVVSMKPGAGEEVAEGSTVLVVISLGAEKATVPNLVGLSSSQGKQLLVEANLNGSSSEAYSSTVSEGSIISQATSAGSKVDKGTSITYVISKGPEITNVSMPNVIGLSTTQAISLLEGSQYEFEVSISETHSSTVAYDYVISSNISSGASIPKGTKITLVVSIGPEESDGQ